MNLWRARALFLVLVLALVTPVMAAQEYHVQSGYASPPPPLSSVPSSPEEIPVWELPPGLLLMLAAGWAAELLIAVKVWVALGYRRVTRSNVLAQAVRSSVFSAIQKNPGIHLRGLARETGIRLGTLRHHLQMLSFTGKIIGHADAEALRFYENNGMYTETRQLVLRHLRNATRKQILGVLIRKPSAGRDEIAGLLGFTGAAVTWHMNVLEADRIIRVERIGRIVRYVIPEDVDRCLNEYLPV
ncbi:MAG: winged helix-turn-helix transcriptional regulator [Methanoregula sp.]|jgi:predicted transcriptional regulator